MVFKREREREKKEVFRRKQSIDCFDFFRAVACIGVVIHHYLYSIVGQHIRIDGIFMQMFVFTSGF